MSRGELKTTAHGYDSSSTDFATSLYELDHSSNDRFHPVLSFDIGKRKENCIGITLPKLHAAQVS